MNRPGIVCFSALSAVAMFGCLDRQLAPLQPCTVSAVGFNVKVNNIEKVDVLFMVDNSNSMSEEQSLLSGEFPRLVRVLATGDKDDDGEQDFPPVKDLHVGVVSSDMGAGGWTGQVGCSDDADGDDGVLRTTGNTTISGCGPTYPKWLEFMPGATVDPGAVAAFAEDFTCVARMGTGGCGFEQQLEAILKALTPSDARKCPPTNSYCVFRDNTSGQGDRDSGNRGFLRDDSLLAIIVITDEEDCSVSDTEIFNPMTSVYPGPLNLRCYLHSGSSAVQPVDRYVDGLLALRPNHDLLVFALIGGIPADLAQGDNFGEILADERMVPRPNASNERLMPSCSYTPAGGGMTNTADPPTRIIRVAQGLTAAGANGLVTSICQENFTEALDAIIEKISDVLGGACLPRALIRDATATVPCDVNEVLPLEGEVVRCSQLSDKGRTLVGVDPETGGEICKINQLAVTGGNSVETGSGWYYDDFSAETTRTCPRTPYRIAFASDSAPTTGARFKLECLQPVQVLVGDGVGATVGTPCETTPTVCDGSISLPALACDDASNTCQIACEADSDCPSSWVCNTTREVGSPICVNPTCGT